MQRVHSAIAEVLYQDLWTGAGGYDPVVTFCPLGMELLDVHLLLFELQMRLQVAVPPAWLSLDDSLDELALLLQVLLLARAQPVNGTLS